jgi:hypothetical protein
MRRLGLIGGLGLAVLVLALPGVASAASPSVTTGGVGSVKTTSATLKASVNPHGQRTVYFFQYGVTTAYGVDTRSKSAGSGTRAVAVSTAISRLTPGTVYHYRVVASNAGGTTFGKDRRFKTAGKPPAPPGVFTGGAFQRTTGGAVLSGLVATIRNTATWYFQFGLTPVYGLETPRGTVPPRNFPQPVTFPVSGLAPHRIYHYRLVAANKDGTTLGADQLFITGRVRPGPVTRNTRKRHLNGRRWALVTSGQLKIPKDFPPAQSCKGTVRVRFFVGGRLVRSLRSPVGGDCKYSASTVITARRGGSRLRIAPLFLANSLLLARSGKLQVVRIG